MNPNSLRKMRVYAYYGSLLIVAIFVIYGFYMRHTNPSTTQKSQKVELLTDSSLTVKDGDLVNIDFVGYLDGEEIKDGTTKGLGMDITVGDGKLMSEIEEELIGHHPGETYTINMVFPDNYKQKDLRGKEADIEMTINGIYHKKN